MAQAHHALRDWQILRNRQVQVVAEYRLVETIAIYNSIYIVCQVMSASRHRVLPGEHLIYRVVPHQAMQLIAKHVRTTHSSDVLLNANRALVVQWKLHRVGCLNHINGVIESIIVLALHSLHKITAINLLVEGNCGREALIIENLCWDLEVDHVRVL